MVCMATSVPIPKRRGKPKSVTSSPSGSDRIRRRHSIAVSSRKCAHEARTTLQNGADKIPGLSRGTIRKLAGKQTSLSLEIDDIDEVEDDVWLKYDDISEDSLADRIKSIVLDKPAETKTLETVESKITLDAESERKLLKSEKVKILQQELSAEVQKNTTWSDKPYTKKDVQMLKEKLDKLQCEEQHSDQVSRTSKPVKRYKGDLKRFKKESFSSLIKNYQEKKKTGNSTGSVDIVHSKRVRRRSSSLDHTSHSSLSESCHGKTTKVKLCQNSDIDKTDYRCNRSASVSDLIDGDCTSSSKLLRSNTNITDSEKIYHKLQGLSKVSKLGCVSPKSRRLSLTSERVDATLDTAPGARNGLRSILVGSNTVVKSSDKIALTGDSLSRCHNAHHLVVRQCRIGSSVAFGLVQVNQNGNGYSEGQGLVTIRMTPDEQGRFGFNVKGGADQGMPIIVSRVAPNTPADLAIPRLNEGDQVLFINGRDVSQHTHEQVVMFIRASRETHSGELVLIVRPNVYVGDDVAEEPDFGYIPESHQITTSAGGANALEASLVLLQESLESGAALAQFEQLYRKKPGMTMNAARLELNIAKNRYRDISPYDQTRVILKDCNGGEYINANYVNMEIPGSGIVNRYIAAQGPLPNTCVDFWQMVWEQHSSLVVMLTTKVERGRVKCHQYWPDLYETMDYGELQVTCVKEEETTSFAFREFNLTHLGTHEERHISHMQYIAWPDHGVPDDPGDFLEFVVKVRQKRTGMVEPTVVHCSAGIGRTGVLITMETAMCLVESNQPVYPLSIVRQMRDQRAMLIQTPSQYKFVCEAILKVYNDRIVKPLEDFHR